MQLDGTTSQDNDPKEYSYKIPAPFGPGKGEAIFTIRACAATTTNTEYRNRMESVIHQSKVRDLRRDKLYERSFDYDQIVLHKDEDDLKTVRAMMGVLYDTCIKKWWTNIQNSGSNLESTKENWLNLAEFNNPDIAMLFRRIQSDLTDLSRISELIEVNKEDQEIKN